MKKKYFITSDNSGNFYLNGVDITEDWYWHFSGLSMEQESRCGRLFINYILRKRPELKVKESK